MNRDQLLKNRRLIFKRFYLPMLRIVLMPITTEQLLLVLMLDIRVHYLNYAWFLFPLCTLISAYIMFWTANEATNSVYSLFKSADFRRKNIASYIRNIALSFFSFSSHTYVIRCGYHKFRFIFRIGSSWLMMRGNGISWDDSYKASSKMVKTNISDYEKIRSEFFLLGLVCISAEMLGVYFNGISLNISVSFLVLFLLGLYTVVPYYCLSKAFFCLQFE